MDFFHQLVYDAEYMFSVGTKPKGNGPSVGTTRATDIAAQPTFLFLSEILHRPVSDASGRLIGKLDDLTVDITEPFPLARYCVICQAWPNQLRLVCRWTDVADFCDTKIRLRISPEQLIPAPPEGINEVRLRRDVLDKQVVDKSGFKIVRVNDIYLLHASTELRAVQVDVGFSGLARRLGVEGLIASVVRRITPNAAYLKSDNLISWRFIETLSPGTSHHHLQISLSQAEVQQRHPTDLAALLAELDPPRRLRLFRALSPEKGAKALAELPSELQARLLEMMPRHEAAKLLGIMPPDEATDLLAGLRNDVRVELLANMSHEEAREVRDLLAYRPGTAGSLMNTEFVALSEKLSVGEALEQLRALAPSAETIYYIYVLDTAGTLVGVLSLRALITEVSATPISQVMLRRPVSVQVDDPLTECAALVAKYKLLAIPVVGSDHTMVGVITIDDVFGEVLNQAWTKKFAHL